MIRPCLRWAYSEKGIWPGHTHGPDHFLHLNPTTWFLANPACTTRMYQRWRCHPHCSQRRHSSLMWCFAAEPGCDPLSAASTSRMLLLLLMWVPWDETYLLTLRSSLCKTVSLASLSGLDSHVCWVFTISMLKNKIQRIKIEEKFQKALCHVTERSSSVQLATFPSLLGDTVS